MVFWDDLGFPTEYSVDAEPEFPAGGEWDYPLVEINLGGSVVGGPQMIVSPGMTDPWVLGAHFTDIGSIYATPDPNSLRVADRFNRVMMVNVVRPADQTKLWDRPLTIARAPDAGLLLIADEVRVSAFGADGHRWTSAVLFDDDLRIRRTDNRRIVCRGWSATGRSAAPVEVTLNAETGKVISP